MVFVIIIYIVLFTEATSLSLNFTSSGTVLFNNNHCSLKRCWSEEGIAKLRARKIFENLILPPVSPDIINSKYVKNMLRYYRQAVHSVERTKVNSYILKEALVDTIGAHFRSEVLPTARLSYYAGYIPYRTIKQVEDFYTEMKSFLNTQGIGWKRPKKHFSWCNMTVVKMVPGYGKFVDPCACLVSKRDINSCIHIPSPLLDDKRNPSALALPFRTRGLVSLTSPNSENVLLKFYTAATRCILRSSPPACRHSDFVNYNNEVWHWMKRDLAPHLIDEKLYAAFGGVLRIAAAVQNYGKGLSRRNLFDDEEDSTRWHPWRTLSDSNVYVHADWTPQLYICIVFLVASMICVLQLCYNYLFGYSNGCHCGEHCTLFKVSNRGNKNNTPAIMSVNSLQRDNGTVYSRQKTLSHGSVRTQKVYDLNENSEKLMDVIMSDDESEDVAEKHIIDVGQLQARGPPQIETDVTHLRIERTPRRAGSRPLSLYTSSITAETYREHSASPSGSSTSARSSGSSASSGSSRPRALSRQPRSARSTSGTELDLYSFTTPPSHRHPQ